MIMMPKIRFMLFTSTINWFILVKQNDGENVGIPIEMLLTGYLVIHLMLKRHL